MYASKGLRHSYLSIVAPIAALGLLIAPACERKPMKDDSDVAGALADDDGKTEKKPDEPVTGRKTLVVDAKRVDCPEAPGRCLRVKQERGDWQPLYPDIQGFDYEEGYVYTIIVDVSEVPDPPTGGTALAYRLLEVVGKTEAPVSVP